jgi:hypothetical protein
MRTVNKKDVKSIPKCKINTESIHKLISKTLNVIINHTINLIK